MSSSLVYEHPLCTSFNFLFAATQGWEQWLSGGGQDQVCQRETTDLLPDDSSQWGGVDVNAPTSQEDQVDLSTRTSVFFVQDMSVGSFCTLHDESDQSGEQWE